MEDTIRLPVVNGFRMVELGEFEGYDENGVLRSLNGRLTGAHQVVCSAAENHAKDDRISTSDMTVEHGSYSQQNWSGNENSF